MRRPYQMAAATMAAMLPDGRRLGAHLALDEGMVQAADRAVEIGLDALQVFSDNPTARRRRTAPSAEIPAFRGRLAAGRIAPLVIHASYLVNLAGNDPAYHERTIAILASELRTASRFGATLVNVHVGSHGGAGPEAGTNAVVDAIRGALDAELEPEPEPDLAEDDAEGSESDAVAAGAGSPPQVTAETAIAAAPGAPSPTIVLENSVGSGFALGVDLDELAAIADALEAAGVPSGRVGFCLDTAHAWGAGLDLADAEVVDAFIAAFDRRIGLGRLALIHLNDSRSELGSRTDRHEHVGAGRIGAAAMTHLLRHPALAGVTYILETPGMDEGYDAINVARVQALANGESPPPLPPEAFTLRGSRVRAARPGGGPPERGPR